MDNINREYIDKYIKSLIRDEDKKLDEFYEKCLSRKLPIIHKEVGQFLKLVIKSINAKNIIEIGTNVGYSSIFMSKAMEGQGKVVTLERDEEFYLEALENIKGFELENNIEVYYGEAIDILDNIEGNFDMAFIDAAKSYYQVFFDKCALKMKAGGIIISDNVLYQGMVASDDLLVKRKRTSVRHMREFLESITNDDRYISSVLPLGDGLAVTLIK